MSQNVRISRERVKGVVEIATKAAAYEVRNLHPLEAIIGFAEVTGRAIAAQDVDNRSHNEMIQIATRHIVETVKASYTAAGKNPNLIK